MILCAAIGELRAAMGDQGQAAGPAQPPQPAQPPLHPWTAAALPAGLFPGQLQAQQARQAGAGAAPNPGQQPFDIVAFAGAAAAEAEAAAAAAGAAADYADVALAQSGARADATARGASPHTHHVPDAIWWSLDVMHAWLWPAWNGCSHIRCHAVQEY